MLSQNHVENGSFSVGQSLPKKINYSRYTSVSVTFLAPRKSSELWLDFSQTEISLVEPHLAKLFVQFRVYAFGEQHLQHD